jgi:hypothetical protein
MAKAKVATQQQTHAPTITVNGQPAATTVSLTGNTGLPVTTTASGAMATMAATLTTLAQSGKVTPAARLQAMQANGTAAQGATALAHKAGNATLGKLPAGSYTINPGKAGTVSKAGFNAVAWAAIVATGGGLPATLASAVQAATGCAGNVASAHVAYRIKQGWLQPVAA